MNLLDKYLLEQEEQEDNGEEEVSTDQYLTDLIETVHELIDTLDMDNLSDEQEEIVSDLMELTDEDGDYPDLDEARTERVVRGGKRTKRLKRKKGYKVVDGKYVKMSSSEKRTRSKAAKRSAKKRKSKKSSTERKRKRSLKKRR